MDSGRCAVIPPNAIFTKNTGRGKVKFPPLHGAPSLRLPAPNTQFPKPNSIYRFLLRLKAYV